MSLYTDKLNLKLIQKTDKFINDSINASLEDADDKLVGIAHLDEPSHWALWKANTTYALNDIVRISLLKSNQYMQCIVGGTSNTTSPTSIIVGSPITDGTVQWMVRELGAPISKHNDLTGRNLADAHPISAITNLQTTLDNKVNKGDYTEAGIIDFPTIINNGDGTITLSGGSYNFYSDSTGSVPLKKYSGISQTLTLVDGANNYVCAYASNNAMTYILASRASINYRDTLPVYTVFRNGTSLEPVAWGTYAKGLASLLLKRQNRTSRFTRESGLMISESTGRIINLTSGVVWFSVNELPLDAVTSSADDVYQCINTNGTWAYTKVTQYNNTQYNNLTTGLATLDNNKYNVTWVYRDVKTDAKKLFLVLGTASYTLSDAQASAIPAIPAMLDTQCMLVGRIICKKDATSATSIESAFTLSFSGGGGATEAVNISIADTGNYYTGSDVETALQEAGKSYGARPWLTATLYKKYQLVTYSGCLYRCNIEHTSSTFSTDTSKWDIVCANIQPWATGIYYALDSKVYYNNRLYECISGHTATNFVDDISNWKCISAGLGVWTSLSQYFVNDVVTYNNVLYRCKTKTNKTTFDPTEWEPILTNIKDWTPNTSYIVGQLAINDSRLYECTTANTSSTTFIADTTKWKEISADIPEITMWVPFKDYVVDNLIIYNNNLYSCTTAHTSTQLFTETYWQIISAGSGLNTWKSGSQYLVDNVVVYNNRIYKCKTQNSDSVFTIANWTAIVCDSVTNWEPNTLYQPNTFVMDDGVLYICLTSNTSSDYFIDDTAYWLKIYSSASSDYEQISRLSITAPVYIDAEINKTSTFLTSPVEVLKLAPGDSGVTENQFTFSVGDGSKFTLNGVTASNSRFLIFDDTVRQNHNVSYAFNTPTKMVTNYYAESEEIDLSAFKLVNGVRIS